jgi:hypothetical protein
MRGFLTLLLVFGFQIVSAQSGFINNPTVIGNGGGTWIQGDYNLSFTVGEVSIETLIQNQTIFTQGFHQETYEITQVNEFYNDFDISVFPNPTKDIINIDCGLANAKGDLYVKDMEGSIVYFLLDFSTNQIQSIDFSKFSTGVYFIEIALNSKNKMVYQIQKLN